MKRLVHLATALSVLLLVGCATTNDMGTGMDDTDDMEMMEERMDEGMDKGMGMDKMDEETMMDTDTEMMDEKHDMDGM